MIFFITSRMFHYSVCVFSSQVTVQSHGSKDEPKKYLSDVMCTLAQACLHLATGPHPLQYTAMVAMNKVVDVAIVHRLTKERFVSYKVLSQMVICSASKVSLPSAIYYTSYIRRPQLSPQTCFEQPFKNCLPVEFTVLHTLSFSHSTFFLSKHFVPVMITPYGPHPWKTVYYQISPHTALNLIFTFFQDSDLCILTLF